MGKKPPIKSGAVIRDATATPERKRAHAQKLGKKGGQKKMANLRAAGTLSQVQSEIAKLRPPLKKPGPHCACGRNTKARALARWPNLKGKHCLLGPKEKRRPCTVADRESV